jgi:hypothetical protein
MTTPPEGGAACRPLDLPNTSWVYLAGIASGPGNDTTGYGSVNLGSAFAAEVVVATVGGPRRGDRVGPGAAYRSR